LVSGAGTPEGLFHLQFAVTTEGESSPAVAGSESNQQYLVLWTCPLPWSPTNIGIFGLPVATSGAFLGGADWLAGAFAYRPAVAAGPVGDFLMAFEDTINGGYSDIWGKLWGNRLYLPLVLRNY